MTAVVRKWTPEEEQAIETAARWYDDPVAFVREMFVTEPDEWQARSLRSAAVNLRTGMSASKGPGKTTVLAWIGWWFLYTRYDAQALAASITADNLRDNLWPEFAKWYAKAPALQQVFVIGGERIKHRERPDTWWLSARSFAQNADRTAQSNTLAGFHGEHILVLLDEMGDFPIGVLSAANGIFATEAQEARLAAAWNCTDVDGAAYQACTRERGDWTIIPVSGDPDDTNRSPRVSLEWAQGLIDKYGRDDPLVRINVLGLFPIQGSNKLLGPDDIVKAEQRDAPMAAWIEEPIIWGLDCARFGTDKSKLIRRQGPIAWRSLEFSHMDGVELANRVAYVINDDLKDAKRNPQHRPPDYICVDVTGIGASPVDQLRRLGWGDRVMPIDFGSSPDDESYADKRAEMYWRAAEWIKTQGCLPAGSGELSSQLCEPKIDWAHRGKRTCRVLESKEQIRERTGGKSPDEADAFALTFAIALPVRRDKTAEMRLSETGAHAGGGTKYRSDYNPYARSV